ncbi:MAG: hypothetical protein SFU86_15860 [Pirellulaceae bacterium]|nr:hypothetical protein [Pirellulaceae bacterium]
MDASLHQHLPVIAVVLSGFALALSLVAVFPGLKGLLSAVRDGILWLALLLLLGGAGFVVWQHLQQTARPAASAARPILPQPAVAPAARD